MRRILYLLLVFLPVLSFGQSVQKQGNPNVIIQYRGGYIFDSLIVVPKKDTVAFGAYKGDFIRHMANDSLYFWDGAKYVAVGAATGGGPVAEGDLIAGENIELIGDVIDRLYGSGDIEIRADLPEGILKWSDTAFLATKYDIDTVSNTLHGHIIADQDLSPTNEIQTVTWDNTDRELSISDGNTVVIPFVDTSSLSDRINDRVKYSDTNTVIATKDNISGMITTEVDPTIAAWIKAITQADITQWDAAEPNVQSDWNATSGDAEILNKPASLPPSGAAGGDLTGTYPNPQVVDNSHNHTIANVTGLQAALNGKPSWSDTVATIATKSDLDDFITTEVDPTVPAHVKAITTTNITNWNQAFTWGNHATAGYESASNKRTSLVSPNNTTYPTTQAVQNAINAVPTHDAVTVQGEDYLSLSGQVITAEPIDLSGSNTTGNLPAARVTESTTRRFATDAEKASWNGKQNALGTGTGSQYLYRDQTWKQIQYGEIAGTPTIPTNNDYVSTNPASNNPSTANFTGNLDSLMAMNAFWYNSNAVGKPPFSSYGGMIVNLKAATGGTGGGLQLASGWGDEEAGYRGFSTAGTPGPWHQFASRDWVSSQTQNMVEWTDTVSILATQYQTDTLSGTLQAHISADQDLDPGNELQAISRVGTDITISQGGGTVSIADNDNNSTNEIQTIIWNATSRVLGISGANNVTIALQDTSNLSNRINAKEDAFSKGDIVQGTGLTLVGDLTQRLVGPGNVTLNAIPPDLSGYVEYADTVAIIATKNDLGGYIPTTEKGAAGGVATLDPGGKVPVSQLPSSIMFYKGVWNAATNTPTLVNGSGTTGWVYKASPGGTVDFGAGPVTFSDGDWAIYNGTEWERSGNTESVVSVNGQQGVVNLNTDDIPEGTAIYFTAARARQAISGGTGINYNNSTGVIVNSAPNATHTGDVTGATALTIAQNAVTNAKLADMPANTLKGRLTGAGDPADLTPAQVRGLLNVSQSTDVQKYADTNAVDATRHWVGQQGYLTTETDPLFTAAEPSLMRYRGVLGVVNLDDYINTGIFVQTGNANAASGQNYPVTFAGILTVERTLGTHIKQTYTVYRGAGAGQKNAVYVRYLYSGTWTSWDRLATVAATNLQSVTDAGPQTTNTMTVLDSDEFTRYAATASDHRIQTTGGWARANTLGVWDGTTDLGVASFGGWGNSTNLLYGYLSSKLTQPYSNADLKFIDGKVGINLVGVITPNYNLTVNGNAAITSLSGAGNRMVIAEANGALSTQTIPTVPTVNDFVSLNPLAANTIVSPNQYAGGLDTLNSNSRYSFNTNAVNKPSFITSGGMADNGNYNVGGGNYTTQTLLGWGEDQYGYRTRQNGTWGSWYQVASRQWVNSQLPVVNNGTLTLSASGIASGSANFTANQSGNSSFTVNVPGTNLSGSLSANMLTILSSTGTATSVNLSGLIKDLQSVTDDGNKTTNVLQVKGQGGLDFQDLDGIIIGYDTSANSGNLLVDGASIINTGPLTTRIYAQGTGVGLVLGQSGASFNSRVAGSPAVASNEFVTLSQLPSLAGYVQDSRAITAGNGLTGGGNLTADRTISLGTPGATTLSSTNAVTATSHTHAFTPGGTTAQYIRGNGTLATFPTLQSLTGSASINISGTAIQRAALTGDVTAPANSNATTIANLAVTNAKINDVAWSKITGAPTVPTVTDFVSLDPLASNTFPSGSQYTSDLDLVNSNSQFTYNTTVTNKPAFSSAGGVLTSSTYNNGSSLFSGQMAIGWNGDDEFGWRRRYLGVWGPWVQAASRQWVSSQGYTNNIGTVTSVSAGNGMTFSTITGTGSVTLGTPGTITLGSTNAVQANSHTHAFTPGGTTAQYIRGNGTLATFPTIPTATDYVTTNSSQSGLHGAKSWTGLHTFSNQVRVGTGTTTEPLTVGTGANGSVARFIYDNSDNLTSGIRLQGKNVASSNYYADFGLNAESSIAGIGIGTTGITLPINKTGTTNMGMWVNHLNDLFSGRHMTVGFKLFIPTLANATPQMLTVGAAGEVSSQAIPSTSGTVTSVSAGNGLNFSTITGSGAVTLGTPGSITANSTNSVTSTSHTHELANNSVTTAKIIDNAVTLAKIQPIDPGYVLGRYSANTGNVQPIKIGDGLMLDAVAGELRATASGGGGTPTVSVVNSATATLFLNPNSKDKFGSITITNSGSSQLVKVRVAYGTSFNSGAFAVITPVDDNANTGNMWEMSTTNNTDYFEFSTVLATGTIRTFNYIVNGE